jgi:propionyl-CoA carboxylase alpha chain
MVINRLLVANRGEIARRVFVTCRRLGVETVAVHSGADSGLPFVAEADVAVPLAGDAPAETYLRPELMIDAARRAGADAVHPGYGFLSESADFARAVIDAGLTWVGPSPEAIEAMGSKVGAKQLMEKAGVPVLGDLTTDTATEADLPVLVKASAGGGGRGMRVVRDLASLADAVSQASAEALSAFGDGTVFVEPYVEHGRHVEVQVIGDLHGTVQVLGERDCSLQRRHQKVVEEAPAPGLDDSTRLALHDAARAAAEAIGYVGAGTVEFLLDATTDPSRFWFLEMNTRLQVEHPVTECVTGLDLVELQISVAEGGSVTGVSPSAPHGHAIEVRLYAEDPTADYQPQSGLLTRFEIPDADGELVPLTRPGVRLDSGFTSGTTVSTHYDAMLAKVIAWAPTREGAARRLAAALQRAHLHGVRTNRDLLVEVLRHPRFLAGEVSTAFLAVEELTTTRPGGTDAEDEPLACFAAAVALTEHEAARRPGLRAIPAGWRNVTSAPQRTVLEHGGSEVPVAWYGGRSGFHLHSVGDVEVEARCVSVEPVSAWLRVVVEHQGRRVPFEVAVTSGGAQRRADVDWAGGHLALRAVPRFVDPVDQVAEGSLLAPMPGSVIAVRCSQGEQVEAGQPVLVLEAMKMQHTVSAPHHGTVTELLVAAGSQVNAGEVLAVVQPRSPNPDNPTDTEPPGADA